VAELQILVFVHSTEVSTGVIKTEGDKNYFIHMFELVKLFRMKNLSKMFQGGN
jgi:hypothetical protein